MRSDEFEEVTKAAGDGEKAKSKPHRKSLDGKRKSTEGKSQQESKTKTKVAMG